MVVRKDGYNDVAGEHGDGGLLPRHDALLVVPARAPVETAGGIISHLNIKVDILNNKPGSRCQWGETHVGGGGSLSFKRLMS